MSILESQKVIAIEEHYYDPNVISYYKGVDARTGSLVKDQLLEIGEQRIKEMDECSIDVQVLSHGAPATQRITSDAAIEGLIKECIRMIVSENFIKSMETFKKLYTKLT